MTTTARKLTSITTALAIAASAMVPMATSASAEGWRDGHRRGHHHASRHDDDRSWGRGGKHRRWAHRRHRHRHHDNTGKYVALGVGALMLGVILSEAARD